jgi:hypothetical protein
MPTRQSIGKAIGAVLIILLTATYIAWFFTNNLGIEYKLAITTLALIATSYALSWYFGRDEDLETIAKALFVFAIIYLFIGVIGIAYWYAGVTSGSLSNPIGNVTLKVTPVVLATKVAHPVNATNSTKDPPTLQVGDEVGGEEGGEEEIGITSEEEGEEEEGASPIYNPVYWVYIYTSSGNATEVTAGGQCVIVAPPAYYDAVVSININLPTNATIIIYNITLTNPFKPVHCLFLGGDYGIRSLPAGVRVDSISPASMLLTRPITLDFACDAPPLEAVVVTNYGNYTTSLIH